MSNQISLQQAVDMTTLYRANKLAILAPTAPLDVLCISETFPKVAVTNLMSKPGAEFCRIYYGMDTQLKIHAILVAADKDGNDILPPANAPQSSDDDSILEEASRCPPLCPTQPSPLNP